MATTRNIFHDYNKPIVLVGHSGQGNELERLAQSFLTSYYPNQASAGIVRPHEGLLEDVATNKVGWPNVVVVDFAANDGVDSSVKESTVEKLYEAGVLSIYVNVDPVQGTLSAPASEQKKELESKLLANSDYELCIQNEGTQAEDSTEWEHIQWELSRLLARARLAPAVPGAKTPTTNTAHLTMGKNTFFLSLSFPNITQVEPFVAEMCTDVDAMEYRADLLDCRDSRFDLIYGMQLLRRYCRDNVVRVPALPFAGQVIEDIMPIVYTVRTQHQAGTFPDDEEGISKMFEMLQWGLRAGVEVLDVEAAWDKKKTDNLLTKATERYSSQILGSHHVVGKEVDVETGIEYFQNCALDGRAHGAKVVLSVDSQDNDRLAYDASVVATALALEKGQPNIPKIAVCLGEAGKFSRVINYPFTPVTHETLPFVAAPGQMTAKEIMTTRLITKVVDGEVYCILGHNIAYSVSPEMQSAAFRATGLPYKYGRADMADVKEFIDSDFFQAETFGGCSVTIPHKQAILPYVDVKSDAVKAIGSVNTLIARYEVDDNDKVVRKIYGDNTDWRGIFNPLERKIGVQEMESPEAVALILGGGGTARAAAYSASKLGLRRIYYNRTPSKAADLAESFGGTVVTSLEQEGESSLGEALGAMGSSAENIRVVISTLPAAAKFTLPEWVLPQKPVIFDVNYKPYYTKLLEQAEAANCQVVRGSEMLWEQGVGQFELWTERAAPYNVMKSVVLNNCLPKEEEEKK
eukprot:Nitzschia sp. Nitz4//scaffold42_size132992//29193//31433//NITZ4_003385-RA/size132992-processed-gene-0.25-mRNA-1//-1//CDS//3329551676//1747//frame0